MENIIIAVILGIALLYIYRKISSGLKEKDQSACGTCDSCPNRKNSCDTEHPEP